MVAPRFDQLPSAQKLEGGLDGALRKARRFREHAQARRDGFPSLPRGQAEEVEINEIRRRFLIVPDDVAHQDIDDVIIDRDRLAKSRHRRSLRRTTGKENKELARRSERPAFKIPRRGDTCPTIAAADATGLG